MSDEKKFKVGDIVKLKSGGPDMTVKKVTTDYRNEETDSFDCQWFAGKKLDVGAFPLESLVLITEEKE